MSSQDTRNAVVHDQSYLNSDSSSIATLTAGKEVANPVEVSNNAEADSPVAASEKVVGIEPPPNGGITAWLQVWMIPRDIVV